MVFDIEIDIDDWLAYFVKTNIYTRFQREFFVYYGQLIMYEWKLMIKVYSQ